MNYIVIFPFFIVLAIFGSLISVVISFAILKRQEKSKKGLKIASTLAGVALIIIVLSSVVIIGSYGLASVEDYVFCVIALMFSSVIYYVTKKNYRKNT